MQINANNKKRTCVYIRSVIPLECLLNTAGRGMKEVGSVCYIICALDFCQVAPI